MSAGAESPWPGRRAGAPEQKSDVNTELDTLDLRLIDDLQRDGRVPYAELARRLNVTEKTVRRRVSRLLEQRYIMIAAVTDPASLGFCCIALALITSDGTRSPIELAAELAQLPEADYVTVTTGEFAVQVELVATDAAELHDIVCSKVSPVAGVRSVELLPYLRVHYQQAARFAAPSEQSGGVRPRPLDDTDRAIIAHLAADGRVPLRDIAAAVEVSEATIRFRYAKLVNSGAVRVMCVVNPLRLGYRFTSWVAVRVGEHGSAHDVAEALTRLDAVSYVALTAGRCDVLAEVIAGSGAALLEILDDEIRTIDGVAALQSWLYVAVHYKATRPRSAAPASAEII